MLCRCLEAAILFSIRHYVSASHANEAGASSTAFRRAGGRSGTSDTLGEFAQSVADGPLALKKTVCVNNGLQAANGGPIISLVGSPVPDG